MPATRPPILLLVLLLTTAAAADVDPALSDRVFLSEITRHLYRWHLDENDVQPEINRGEFVFRIMTLHPRLDEDDASRFAEIVLPRIGVRVRLKKADYRIPELGLHVQNDGYRIVNVARVERSDGPAPGTATEVRLDFAEMRDFLFQTRTRLRPPDDALLAEMRVAARAEVAKYFVDKELPFPTTPQAIHLAPVSPVANEAWVFWENARLLLHFQSDGDLQDPVRWSRGNLTVELFDLDEQVVVSLDEVAGSNAYVTRDMVGRVLYNCVVLGRRVLLEPAPVADSEPPDDDT